MLPESWIDKIFTRMQGRYGSLFLDRWKGCDIRSVKETWADELGGFLDQQERISYALKITADEKFPPTLPEFIAACRRAPAKESLKLEHKQTPEEMAHAKELAHKATEAVKPKEFDGLLWAKRPKSQKAMDFIADGKKEARRFPQLAAIFDKHVREGIANEAGKLLRKWNGYEWVKA